MSRRVTRLHVAVEERVTDPDRWHPRLRRRVKEWAETRVYWRRSAPSYPTREARAARVTPLDAVRKLKAAA